MKIRVMGQIIRILHGVPAAFTGTVTLDIHVHRGTASKVSVRTTP